MKSRSIPLNVHVRKTLHAYFRIRPDEDEEDLFPGQRGPLSEWGIHVTVKGYANQTPNTLSLEWRILSWFFAHCVPKVLTTYITRVWVLVLGFVSYMPRNPLGHPIFHQPYSPASVYH